MHAHWLKVHADIFMISMDTFVVISLYIHTHNIMVYYLKAREQNLICFDFIKCL